eukprot:COSAG02_NODE_4473_length_5327_cov_2.650344_3_plen_105_part_00
MKRTAISVCLLTQIFIAVAFWLLLIDANATTTTVAVNAFTTGSRTVLPIQERVKRARVKRERHNEIHGIGCLIPSGLALHRFWPGSTTVRLGRLSTSCKNVYVP